MEYKKLIWLLPLLGAFSALGCSGEDQKLSASEEQKMKDGFKPGKFDINKVPPENRERVLGMMKAMGQKPPSAPGGTPPPAATGGGQ